MSLVGRYLNWGDGEHYQTFRVEEDLSNGFFLLRYVSAKTRETIPSCRVVHLGQIIACEDNCVFYDDAESVDDWAEEDDKRVVSLVPHTH
jgi:hypothetical protein